MSNCINSGINKIFVLTQFNSASLNRHLARTYFGNGINFGDGFVEVCFLYANSFGFHQKCFAAAPSRTRVLSWTYLIGSVYLDTFSVWKVVYIRKRFLINQSFAAIIKAFFGWCLKYNQCIGSGCYSNSWRNRKEVVWRNSRCRKEILLGVWGLCLIVAGFRYYPFLSQQSAQLLSVFNPLLSVLNCEGCQKQ